MKKKHHTKWFLKWNFWFILSVIAVVFAFAASEKAIEEKQPSPNWSMGVRIMEDLPTDERKIDLAVIEGSEEMVLGAIKENYIQLYRLDAMGEVVQSTTIDHDAVDTLKLIQVEALEDLILVKVSDRIILEVIEVDNETMTPIGLQTLSTHSEQFDSEGEYTLAADDNKLSLFKGQETLFDYAGYEDVKSVVIEVYEDQVFGALNTADGGQIFRFKNGTVEWVDLLDVPAQKTYGYIRDIYVTDDIVTVMSHKYDRMNPGSATALGIWQFEKNGLDQFYFQPYYHVGTDLYPVIVGSNRYEVTYVLGSLQAQRSSEALLMKYPQAAGGTFANVSKYTREKDEMTENTRLTITRNYPIAYFYVDYGEGSKVFWLDKEENTSVLKGAGNTSEWIQSARSRNQVNYLSLLVGSLIQLFNTLFLGIVSLLSMLAPYNYGIIAFILALMVFKRFAPLEALNKEKVLFWTSVVAFAAFKLWLFGISNLDFKLFAHIYPFFFGNAILMGVTSIFTTAYALMMLYLFKREHPYYNNRFLHFMFYFGMEMFFIMFTFMAYFVSALVKSNFMM